MLMTNKILTITDDIKKIYNLPGPVGGGGQTGHPPWASRFMGPCVFNFYILSRARNILVLLLFINYDLYLCPVIS